MTLKHKLRNGLGTRVTEMTAEKEDITYCLKQQFNIFASTEAHFRTFVTDHF